MIEEVFELPKGDIGDGLQAFELRSISPLSPTESQFSGPHEKTQLPRLASAVFLVVWSAHSRPLSPPSLIVSFVRFVRYSIMNSASRDKHHCVEGVRSATAFLRLDHETDEWPLGRLDSLFLEISINPMDCRRMVIPMLGIRNR